MRAKIYIFEFELRLPLPRQEFKDNITRWWNPNEPLDDVICEICEKLFFPKKIRKAFYPRKKIKFWLFSLRGVAKLCWFHQFWLKLYCKHFHCVDFLSRCWLNQIFRIYDCYALKIPTQDRLFICILIIFSAFAFFIFPPLIYFLYIR